MLSQNDQNVLSMIFDGQQKQQPIHKLNSASYEAELKAVQLCESDRVTEGIKHLTSLIDADSNNASAYLNRAQAHLLVERRELCIEDLNKAIECATEGDQVLLGKAHCQRAMLRHLISREEKLSKEVVEDFEKAASFGNEFAKNELVRVNPYAAMCNAILPELQNYSRISK